MYRRILKAIVNLKVLADERGQDMVEYALLAGFITIAVGAGYPPISEDISAIFSKLGSIADEAP